MRAIYMKLRKKKKYFQNPGISARQTKYTKSLSIDRPPHTDRPCYHI